MSLKYSEYLLISNNISFWIINNNKKIKMRKEYSLSVNGKKQTKSLDEVKKIILKSKNKNNTAWGRKFLEGAVIDNKDTSLFPKYVTYNGKQYTKSQYIYAAKYVTKWWSNKEHKKAPATVPTGKSTGCTNPYTSHPHFTSQGAGQLGQITPYTCGPHSIRQALKKFGIDIPESTLASWAGTTTSGTDHQGIETAIAKAAKKHGIKLKVDWKNFSDFGKTTKERFTNLGKLICKSNVSAFEHIGYQCSGECSSGTVFGHYEHIDKINISTGYVRALNSLGSRAGNGYYGHLQDRSFSLEAHFISNISQKSICVITKG